MLLYTKLKIKLFLNKIVFRRIIMKKSEKTVIEIYLFVILIIVIGGFAIWKYVSPPRVKGEEKKNVTAFVENYLTEKYGEHRFKVVQIDYKFPPSTSFFNDINYSNPIGYTIYVKSDVVKYSSVHILGIFPNEYKISSDSFIWDYYLGNIDFYKRYQLEESIKPVDKMQTYLLNKIKQEFESTCQIVTCCNLEENLPNNIGRIPTIEELKNNLSFYEVLSFNYTLTNKIKNEEEYENNLIKYLNRTFGGDWSVHLYSEEGNVSCNKE